MRSAILQVVMLACGAAGLYLALPGGRRNLRGLAFILLAIAAGALVGLTAPVLAGGAERGWFFALSVVGLIGAVRLITHARPVYSALYFILVIVAVTGLLVLLLAHFLAAALLIIYAGAILVTYLFVIMLAQRPEPVPCDTQARAPFWGCIAAFALLAVITARLLPGAAGAAAADTPEVLVGSTLEMGKLLLTDYVIAVELAGVLLLAALVGAIAVARRRGAPAEGEAD